MNLLYPIISTAVVIAVLICIYIKYKAENESYLGMKLIGYYILGAFRLNLNRIALPLGFIIFILFFKPKINSSAKRMAAWLGLLIFITGLLVPYISEVYFERTREINASNTNLYKVEYVKDLSKICHTLKIPDSSSIDGFSAEFKKDGSIRMLRFDLVVPTDKGYNLFHVQLSTHDCKYRINPVKVNEWLQYPRLMPASYAFEIFDKLGLEKIKPTSNYDFYTLGLSENSNYGDLNRPVFLIQDHIITKIDKKQLPNDAHSLILTGMDKITENSWEGKEYIYYCFR